MPTASDLAQPFVEAMLNCFSLLLADYLVLIALLEHRRDGWPEAATGTLRLRGLVIETAPRRWRVTEDGLRMADVISEWLGKELDARGLGPLDIVLDKAQKLAFHNTGGQSHGKNIARSRG